MHASIHTYVCTRGTTKIFFMGLNKIRAQLVSFLRPQIDQKNQPAGLGWGGGGAVSPAQGAALVKFLIFDATSCAPAYVHTLCAYINLLKQFIV